MKLDIHPWTHPRTEERRNYINNWAELVGVEIYRYKTGNLSTVFLDDDKISNCLARETLSASVWYDDQGKIFIQRRSGRTAISEETIRERLQPYVDAELEQARAKAAEEMKTHQMAIGEVKFDDPTDDGKIHGKVMTSAGLKYFSVSQTKRYQRVYFYDLPREKFYRAYIFYATNKDFHESEALKTYIKNSVTEN